jgi:hypothetical protein
MYILSVGHYAIPPEAFLKQMEISDFRTFKFIN